ncbi:hypothetical protein [Pedobacter metabolipauper]|uniref:Uncharacterized protein n=1 Tax=Pedobacter metabolipauper TaxID=425513 RepID=A0A4R6SZS7_9SPHI|nr:hypothetical protein [Pedobacter metabolipauper]TDQ11976.1 hypothetical protein ATK78_1106 [Pedobacter metabolipauper]
MKTDLVEIFQTIRASLQPYATLGFSNRTNSETNYDLWSDKNVVIEDRQVHEVFFASVVIEDGYVAFNLMGVNGTTDLNGSVGADLLKLLKDRSCFEIKELDDLLMAQIDEALAVGYKIYKESGWI